MKISRVLSFCLAVALLSAPLWSAAPVAPPPGPEPAAAPPPPQDAFTKDLLARLNSADPAQRAAAQKELAAIAKLWQQPEIIQKMVDATPDKDLQEALQDRLGDLHARQLALEISNLPPISLSVNGVSTDDLSAALNEALHTPNAFMTNAGRGGFAGGNAGTFTLDVKDQPFWDVFAALSQQQPLTLSFSTTGLRLVNSGTSIRRYATDGPAMAYVTNINYQRTIAFQTPNADSPVQSAMTAQITFAVDPRIRVAQVAPLTLASAVDDAGNNLANPASGRGGVRGGFGGASRNMVTFSVALQPTPTIGKTLSMTLQGTVSALASETTGTLKDLENNNGATLTVAGRTFTLQNFAVNGSTANFNLNSSPIGFNAGRGGGGQPAIGNNAPATATVYDSTGRQVWTFALSAGGGVGGGMSVNNAAGPYRLEIRVPDKTVDIPVKLVLKDVPLPSLDTTGNPGNILLP